MNGAARSLVRLISALLDYPEDDFFLRARLLEDEMDLLPAPCASPLRAFVRAARNRGLRALREEHVAVFDLDRECSLSLAWHRYGDDPRLGRALAALNELYRDAGYEPLRGVLPDHLPLVLEFAAVAPDWARQTLLDGFGREVLGLCARLEGRHAESPYVLLFRPLAAALGPAPARSLPVPLKERAD